MLRYRRPSNARKGLRDATNDMETQEKNDSTKSIHQAPLQIPPLQIPPLSKKRKLHRDDHVSSGIREQKNIPEPKLRQRNSNNRWTGSSPRNGTIDIYVDPLPNQADLSEDQEKKYITSLFQSGSGKTVRIAADKVEEYQNKFNEESHDTSRYIEAEQDATKSNLTLGNEKKASDVVPSLFQTGSGRTVHISAEKVKSYQKQMESLNESDLASNTKENGGKESSLFQTGSGKRLKVSSTLAAKYKKTYDGEPDDVTSKSIGVIAQERSIHTHNEQIVSNLFQTAAGNKISYSAAKAKEFLQDFDSQNDTKNDEAELVPPLQLATLTTLFQTGSGRSVKVSASSVEKFQRQYEAIDTSNFDQKEISNKEASISESGNANEQNENLNSKGPSTSLFQTASGRNVNISMEKVLAYQRIFNENIEDNVTDKNEMLVVEQSQSLTSDTTYKPDENLEETSSMSNPLKNLRDNDAENAGGTTLINHQADAIAPINKVEYLRDANNYISQDTSRVDSKPITTELPVQKSIPPSTRRGSRAFQPPKPKAVVAPEPATKTQVEVVKTSSSKYKAPQAIKIAFNDLVPAPPPDSSSCVFDITPFNATMLQFTSQGTLTLQSHESSVHLLYAMMVSSQFIQPSLGATLQWFLNHYRWIVWKCASMERIFGNDLYGQYLTESLVQHQLVRRFQKELEMSHRPILKKIYQRDAHPGNTMVLVIVATFRTHWVVSDGWYAMFALPDEYLLSKKHDLVGTKIAVWNASLVNCNEGMDPLESPVHQSLTMTFDSNTHPYLSIHINSTRIVHWYLPLGLEDRRKYNLLESLPLRALKPKGGLVRSIRVVVLRSSRLLFLQPKDATGPRVLTEKTMENFPQAQATAVPFIRLKVICSHQVGPSLLATLSVWRPSEEVQTLCKEGVEVLVSSVAITGSTENSRKENGLSLSASKHSTFTKPTSPNIADVLERVGYQPRSCVSIADINLNFAGEVDVCIYIIRLTDDNSHAFATDTSLKLLSIRLPSMTAKSLQDWKRGSIICIRDLLVSHYDENLGLLDSVLTETSEVLKRPSKQTYFANSLQNLKAAIDTGANHTLIDALDSYICKTILHTCATQDYIVEDDQGMEYKDNIPTTVKHDLMIITGHLMHLELLPSDLHWQVVLSVDDGSQILEIFFHQSVIDDANDFLTSSNASHLVRIFTKVYMDDACINSCHRWEFTQAKKLVGLCIERVSILDQIQSLLSTLS
ncbi:hypothetical protein THRCLA_11517 [Thraustotheca clavata]|uniref:BRCA2 OB1 domain-containing protein n=1 Tax=Thraustotheca clavata TaxID=74557 RepID=A0A1V9Y7J5_9STRA|nr:hypothetical protein THRCLA_11517 [Thraustotheca clavata]